MLANKPARFGEIPIFYSKLSRAKEGRLRCKIRHKSRLCPARRLGSEIPALCPDYNVPVSSAFKNAVGRSFWFFLFFFFYFTIYGKVWFLFDKIFRIEWREIFFFQSNFLCHHHFLEKVQVIRRHSFFNNLFDETPLEDEKSFKSNCIVKE